MMRIMVLLLVALIFGGGGFGAGRRAGLAIAQGARRSRRHPPLASRL